MAHSVDMIQPMLDATKQETLIISACIIGILFGVYNAWWVLRINIIQDAEGGQVDEEQAINKVIPPQKLDDMVMIAKLISDGSDTFLKTEYTSIGIFMAIFTVFMAFTVEAEPGTYYTTCAFVLGGLSSTLAGYIGMWIAVRANVRTTKMCNNALEQGFIVAFRGGAVLGFVLVSTALLNLLLLIMVYKKMFLNFDQGVTGRGYQELFEVVTGYGLGASAIALFGRVGGGIYTKAADVGADLVGKVI
jgi:Na+/H+-translocating membrane pyrophosphatase